MGENGVTIVVRLMSAEGRKKYKDGLDVKYRGPSWVEFHKVHVKEEEEEIQVEKNCYPDLLCWGRIVTMLLVGSKLYLLGAEAEAEGKGKGKGKERSSVLDLNATHKEWEHLPLPLTAGSSHKYCAMDGKIYHYEDRHRYADDLDFYEFIWSPFSPNHAVLGAILPDPAKKRMLFNLYPGCFLCAYNPANRSFEILGSHMEPWSDATVVVDNIAYVHQPETGCLIHAFDLSSNGVKRL